MQPEPNNKGMNPPHDGKLPFRCRLDAKFDNAIPLEVRKDLIAQSMDELHAILPEVTWDFEAIDDAHISRDEIYNSFEQRKLLLEDQFPGITLPMPHKESIPEAIHQHTTTLSARLTPDEMLTLIKYELEHRSNCPPELRDSVAQDILEQSVQNRERRIKKFEHMIEQAEDRIQRSRKIAWLGTGAMVLYTPYLALQALRLNAALFQPQISSGLNANFVADVMVSAIVVGAFVAGILTSRSLIRSANAQINQLQESLNKML